VPKTCLKGEIQKKSGTKVGRKPGRNAMENTNVKLTKKRMENNLILETDCYLRAPFAE
jgi:hypothetical protein